MALEAVVTGMRPPHVRQPGEASGCHKLNDDCWVLKCLGTWPTGLHARLLRCATDVEVVGGYLVALQLTPMDTEIQLGICSFSLVAIYCRLIILFIL